MTDTDFDDEVAARMERPEPHEEGTAMVGKSAQPGAAHAKPPSAAVGELAGLMRELREFSPKQLAEIETAVADYHETKAAAEAAQAEADRRTGVARTAESDATTARQALADEKLAFVQESSDTAARLDTQKRELGDREKLVGDRETAVEDAERRLARVREQLTEATS